MSSPQPPTMPAKSDEIPLEDIDKLIATEDPEFAKSLEEVRAVETDKSVVLEASAIDESAPEDPAHATEVEHGIFKRFKLRVRAKMAEWRARLKQKALNALSVSIVFLKTQPKAYLLYTIKNGKLLAKQSTIPVMAFLRASRLQKVMFLSFAGVIVGFIFLLLANVKGVWLPHLMEPITTSLDKYADYVETYDPKDGSESFYSAFPQERHEFLFPKMKVNLRATSENPNPMGAFELVVLVDSKDTAIEVRDREVELGDLLQRALEEESFADLSSELGKSRFKSIVKRDLNKQLTQGWVKEVSFKTFILKP